MPAPALADEAPDALRRHQHGNDGDAAQDDEIPAAEAGEELAQHEEDQRADDRSLDGADAADDDDEDHVGGPVEHAEAGVGRDPQLLQEDQTAGEAGTA